MTVERCAAREGVTARQGLRLRRKSQVLEKKVMMDTVEGPAENSEERRRSVGTILTCLSPRLRARYRAYCRRAMHRRKQVVETARATKRLQSIPEHETLYDAKSSKLARVENEATDIAPEEDEQQEQGGGVEFGLEFDVDEDDKALDWKHNKRDWILLAVGLIAASALFVLMLFRL